MRSHPTSQDLEQYRERGLSPLAFLEVHRHVVTCPDCAAQSNSPQQISRDLDDLRTVLLSGTDDPPYHLSETDLAAYWRNALTELDLEIVESHLITCGACESEVRRQQPVPIQQEVSARAVSSPQPPFWSQTMLPFRRVGARQLLQWTAFAFGGAMLILLGLFLLRGRKGRVPEPPSNTNGESEVAQSANKSTPPEPRIVLVLEDGGQKITLDDRGVLTGLEKLPEGIQQSVKAALQTGKIEPSTSQPQLTDSPSTLLGESGNGLPFVLLSPVGQVVKETQPMFRWRPLEGAASYEVVVTDANLTEVATSPPLSVTEWRITKPLKAGPIYSWQVTALKDGQAITSPVLPAPQAKFTVLDPAILSSVLQVERVYPRSHLAAGVLYAGAGLLTDAERELRAVVRKNPGSRPAADLLRSVQTKKQRHHPLTRRAHRLSPISMKPAQ